MNAPVKVMIVDDEALARERLRRLVEEIGDYECLSDASNGQEAVTLAAQRLPDIVLMDIRMPGMDGVEAARHLGSLEQPPAVVFVTAYDEYALKAFEAQAIGYLLKPVRREKLAETLARATRPTRPQLAALTATTPTQRRSHLSVRARNQIRLIPFEEVRYFQAEQKYVTVFHAGGEDLIEESLRALEEELTADFVRIHRNTLVALRCIEAIERGADGQYLVRLRGANCTLPASRRLAAELLRRFRG